MGTISSGVGLVSGINTEEIISQLLALEARPKTLVQKQNAVLTSQQVAIQDINAKLLALKSSVGSFINSRVFRSTSANSSNESVLTASSSTSATPGSYDFTVARLVSTQQVITQGLTDRDVTAVAPSGATLTFEFGPARLDSDTSLSQLNSGAGVPRGKVQITDRSSASAVIDLSQALTVEDVLEAINNATGISVTASVDGDRFQLADTSGSTSTNLSVKEVGGGTTAAGLGLVGSVASNTLTGSQVNRIGEDSFLTMLNDGNGVRSKDAVDDFRVTRRDGTTFDVDLEGAATIGDVIDKIDTASGGDVTASVNSDGTGLQLVDTSTDNGFTLQVTALNSSQAAADLGILTTDGDGDGTLVGSRVIASLNSKLVKNLRGGSGLTLGQVSITNRAGTATTVDLSSAQSVAELVDLINDAGAGVTASLNSAGNGVLLTDTTGSTASNLVVADVTGSAATQLGLAGSYAADSVDSGNVQVRYISESTLLSALNGGAGVTRGKFKITDSNGASATVDLTQGNEVTVEDVLSEINSRGLAVSARINDNGDGILIEDTGSGASKLKVEESGSTTARDLGILGEAAGAGDDLDGSFEKTVTLDSDDTLDDLVQKVNDAGLNIAATVVNDGSANNPFRLSLLSRVAGGAGRYVFDDGGLGLGATTLVEAQDALVFFGSSDPARGVALTSATNTLTAVVPGVTIDLHNVSTGSVKLTVTRDDSAITEAMSTFVERFNAVTETLDKYDTYDAEKEQRGLLLGDALVLRARNSLFNLLSGANSDVSTQFRTLAQIGVRVGQGGTVTFDEGKFRKALETDFEAVENLLTFKETETDPQTNETTITASGIGVDFNTLLENLTNTTTGTIAQRLDAIDSQLTLNNDRIEDLDAQLERKRLVLRAQFDAMEKALAEMQSQSNSLASLAALVPQIGS
jgi:flagellar hook-associated protein 2